MTQNDDDIDQDANLSAVATDFPRIELPANVKVWLRAAYERVAVGIPVHPQQLLVALWSEIPDFEYRSIDPRVMKHGIEPTLIGILQIDPNTELCAETDRVIRFIKGRIQSEPDIERMTAKEVSDALEISETRVALIFLLISHLGRFWSGAGGNGSIPGHTSITIRDEHVKREYLRYERLATLLKRAAKTDEEQSVDTARAPTFVHSLLDWKLAERSEAALTWINALPTEEFKTLEIADLTAAVERFAIAIPIIADTPVRDQNIAEIADLIIDRKTGATVHRFLLPITGAAEWFQEISMQFVTADSYPLAFLDERRGWIYIKLTVTRDDPEGTLKRKLNERVGLVCEYSAYVTERIIAFNEDLVQKMMQHLTRRKEAIRRGETEAEATGLATIYNPRHAEIQMTLQRLMENLSARFTGRNVNILTADGNSTVNEEKSDLHQNVLKVARYLYVNNYFGSRSITLGELRDAVSLSKEEFDTADEYLLQANFAGGTAGGENGKRWLTPTGVDFARIDLTENRGLISTDRKRTTVDIFISHSSRDIAIAKALVLLFRAALNIPTDRIRCTSVDGHRLPAGVETDDYLRIEMRESKVFLGLITEASLASTYVLFEWVLGGELTSRCGRCLFAPRTKHCCRAHLPLSMHWPAIQALKFINSWMTSPLTSESNSQSPPHTKRMLKCYFHLLDLSPSKISARS